jgi:hypothetical protein
MHIVIEVTSLRYIGADARVRPSVRSVLHGRGKNIPLLAFQVTGFVNKETLAEPSGVTQLSVQKNAPLNGLHQVHLNALAGEFMTTEGTLLIGYDDVPYAFIGGPCCLVTGLPGYLSTGQTSNHSRPWARIHSVDSSGPQPPDS